ncbi:GNAT family N-acetyltransferase [Treponema phagedenis]|uniref:Acetyltransferase, GNAT family n=1 Tax=Treponema phagedenis TaxID=162 RepID=A0A0B7GVJ5_TREPH|nr:GNAT family N-acetyltransferase [Treponema phagedenis]QEJ95525.1 GNAT family N-acetyltransferase [Treponema phagedenis]QSH95494.1 GNAT family N-acetyltransferase [Treponema phagedenis]QSH99678.1 GNAT family N-acetyltransferase [Treponema phagedenis]CEM62709.1 Acetyltransferase, GNAT family [Treponema phagedenis]
MSRSEIRERLKLRQVTKKYLKQFNALLRYAFQVTDKELQSIGWEDEEIRKSKSPIFDKAKVFGWFDGSKLASQVVIFPMRMNIHGKIYDMGGITGVATYPEYTKMGLMHELIIKSLNDMRENHQSISLLYPYSIPFYRKMGWEIISDKMSYTIKDTQLPKYVKVSGMVERVDDDNADYRELHNRFCLKRHGMLLRDELAWEEYWRWDSDDVIVALYYDENHVAQGYIVYLLEEEVFKIKELVYLNQEARHALWNYIGAHFSMVDKVKGYNYANEPMAFLLEDSEISENIRPYFMARIIDFEQFILDFPFAARFDKYKLHFIIDDPMAEWNCGSFSVTWDAAGKTQCTRGGTEGLEVTLSIQTLCTMLMGYKRPSYLRRIERITANDDAIDLLEDIIPVEQPYFSDYF